ncbi:MAG: HEAT repeat domain-containing protein [Planctomycetota bacterium]
MHGRTLSLALALTGLLSLPAFAAPDGGADPAAAPAPEAAAPAELASPEEVKAAVEAYKENWKAKGLKGDERLAQRDWAMQQLAAVQHPEVVDELAKVLKGSDENLRIAAAVHLSSQTALPVQAGKKIAEAIQRNKNDVNFLMAALDSLGRLKFLGATEVIDEMLRHPDFSVKKAAIEAVGSTGDMRLMLPMLKLVQIDPDREPPGARGKNSGQSESDGEGYSWEGAEATVDTGTAGDGDQKAAEKKAKEQAAKNKAEADAKAAASGGSGGKPDKPGKGGGGRSIQELIHPIKKALGALTGEEFDSPVTVHAWLVAHKDEIAARIKELADVEKDQAKTEKEAVEAAK